MQRLILTLLICLGFALPGSASAWWQDDWQYRKQISVDTTPQGAALGQALGRTALLVRLHTGNFTFDGVNESGADLRFVASDDKTVLNHQIESFDPLMGMALIWVDVPDVQGGQRQDLWMYYGNPKAQPANGQPSFDADYTTLMHFDGAAPRDASPYGNQVQGSAVSIEGVIGRAIQFNGQPLLLAPSPSLQLPAGAAFTFSAWVRQDQLLGDQLLLARHEGGNSLLLGVSQGLPFVEVNGLRSAASQVMEAGQWQHLALVGEGGTLSLLQGDLGRSYLQKTQVSELIMSRLPATLQLMAAGILAELVLGLTMGIAAALMRGRAGDQVLMMASFVTVSAPQFVVSLLLLFVFAVKLGWFPIGGYGTLAHLVLPAVTLGILGSGWYSRMMRSSMIEVLRADYIRTARAKGLSPARVVFVHGLRNALIPVLTVFGLQVGALLAGAVLTETIFSWPGIGKWLIESIGARDYPVVQNGILLIACLVILVNFVVDILYGLANPRIRHQR